MAFCGVDGEGGNFDTGHEYMLLRAGKDHVLETGKPLTWRDCLAFLADLPKNRLYVSYFFDYDVTMICRGLREERLRRLLDVDCRRIPKKPCSSFPIDVNDEFQIDYMPGKEFKVRRKSGKWTVVQDVGSFFQSSFVAALRKWFDGDAQYEEIISKIAAGKEQRNEFGAVTEDERQYNILEILMLERLMERFRQMCDSLDIRPQRWEGPGNLVSAVFRAEKLPRNSDIPLFDTDKELAVAANAAYYGGRFEVSHFGEIPGDVYQYDINSAYANTYKSLPCLVHGAWKEISRLPDTGLYLAEVEFQHSAKFHWCTLPIRTKHGTIIFPRAGRGIYWSKELEVAKRYGVKLNVIRGWRYYRHCACQSFRFIDDMYSKRKELGKDGKGMVLKIVLASTYGKLAQSVGCAPYSNPVWAGLIVSSVRAQLIDAALSAGNHGKDVLMLATDGLFCTEKRNLNVGKELGEWDFKTHPDMFIVQSGVYFLPELKPKTRGIPQSRVIAHEADFRQVWSEYLKDGSLRAVAIQLNNFTGMRLALARNKPDRAGQWEDVTKEISFDFESKRVNPRVKGTYVVTDPIPGTVNLESIPYSRVIGGIRAEHRLQFEDQPDWGDQL